MIDKSQMKQYAGTKLLLAIPLTLGAYNTIRGWVMPEGEDPDANGYLVEYQDGGKSNHPAFDNYISWSPVDVFQNAYRPVDNLPFSLALELIKQGHKIARAGWNGKGMYCALIKGGAVQQAIADCYGQAGSTYPVCDAIYMKTADEKLVPWLASQTDILADDWVVVQ